MGLIENLRAEESLVNLAIANDPKPVYMIDGKKVRDTLRGNIQRIAEIKKPYWRVTKPDSKGIERLKKIFNRGPKR